MNVPRKKPQKPTGSFSQHRLANVTKPLRVAEKLKNRIVAP